MNNMKKILLAVVVPTLCLSQLTACGFALRGYQNTSQTGTSQTQQRPVTQLAFGNSVEDIAVKNALIKQFDQLSIKTHDTAPVDPLKPKNTPTATTLSTPYIQVKNIRLQTYRLRGILTEIRMVMSADVSYQIKDSTGNPKNITNNIQVQRSYQYDQATVATDNPQSEQIKVWLYDNLAQRIADQYVALNLPK
ncbi:MULTISPECIES: hypothetical protein [unclassified Moraxella]|uniref:hypothetical protein n=1 Tax=unclassified Moraxella TaxID=2685852 RepID=UPI003AF5CFDB